jgi:hypothetical protein
MYPENFNESLRVIAYFSGGKILPATLFVKNRPINIKKVVFSSKKRVGQVEIVTFSLMSDTAVYEVALNKNTCEWQLKNVFVDG